MKGRLLSLDEAAEILGVSVGTLRRMIARRELPFLKVSGQYRIPSTELRKWVDARLVHPEFIDEKVA